MQVIPARVMLSELIVARQGYAALIEVSPKYESLTPWKRKTGKTAGSEAKSVIVALIRRICPEPNTSKPSHSGVSLPPKEILDEAVPLAERLPSIVILASMLNLTSTPGSIVRVAPS